MHLFLDCNPMSSQDRPQSTKKCCQSTTVAKATADKMMATPLEHTDHRYENTWKDCSTPPLAGWVSRKTETERNSAYGVTAPFSWQFSCNQQIY